MKLVTYKSGSELRGGIVVEELVLDMGQLFGRKGPATVMDLLAGGNMLMTVLRRAAGSLSGPKMKRATVGRASRVRLAAPVPRPGKILALAGNYAEHIRESGREFAKKDKVTPRIFMKPATCAIGHGEAIPIPSKGQFIDWEGELGVVIGRRAKYVSRERALRYVAGYTVFHDVSERRLRIRERQESEPWDRFFDWLNGKWQDGFAPMGPWLVTRDEIREPQRLHIETRVNGKVEQSGSTGQMIFDVADIVHYASYLFTLEPGDVIATGTPAGVGHGKEVRLRPGDVVEIEIEGIGVLRNPVKAERR